MGLRYWTVMMGEDALSRPIAVPKGPSRYAEKQAKKYAARKAERECYRAVDYRDGHTCRVCFRPCSPTSVALENRAERHHMKPRSLGGKHTPENVVTTCKGCHERVHLEGDMKLSGDAQVRDERGRLAGVQVQELTEAGWVVTKMV